MSLTVINFKIKKNEIMLNRKDRYLIGHFRDEYLAMANQTWNTKDITQETQTTKPD